MFMGANYSTGAVFHATPAIRYAITIHNSRISSDLPISNVINKGMFFNKKTLPRVILFT